jgi:hypothetical protein
VGVRFPPSQHPPISIPILRRGPAYAVPLYPAIPVLLLHSAMPTLVKVRSDSGRRLLALVTAVGSTADKTAIELDEGLPTACALPHGASDLKSAAVHLAGASPIAAQLLGAGEEKCQVWGMKHAHILASGDVQTPAFEASSAPPPSSSVPQLHTG